MVAQVSDCRGQIRRSDFASYTFISLYLWGGVTSPPHYPFCGNGVIALTNDEIFNALTQPKQNVDDSNERVELPSGGKSAWTKEQLNGKPPGGKGHPNYFTGKKLNKEKLMNAINAYLSGTGVTQVQAAKMSGLSLPTFMKYANMLYTDGRLDGSHFKDNIGVELVDNHKSATSNDYILDRITKEG